MFWQTHTFRHLYYNFSSDLNFISFINTFLFCKFRLSTISFTKFFSICTICSLPSTSAFCLANKYSSVIVCVEQKKNNLPLTVRCKIQHCFKIFFFHCLLCRFIHNQKSRMARGSTCRVASSLVSRLRRACISIMVKNY